MINPAEEIVNVWLQNRKHFIMNNLVVPKKTRLNVKGRKIGGGRGKEIDFVSTDGKGQYYWIEVSVSPNPRMPGGAEKSRVTLVEDITKKFVDEKKKWLLNHLHIRKVEKWFVYSPNLFPKKYNAEELFCKELEKHKIKAISFAKILDEVYDGLNYLGLDSPRQYIFLLKKMGYKKL